MVPKLLAKRPMERVVSGGSATKAVFVSFCLPRWLQDVLLLDTYQLTAINKEAAAALAEFDQDKAGGKGGGGEDAAGGVGKAAADAAAVVATPLA